jgi:hypothetical protein
MPGTSRAIPVPLSVCLMENVVDVLLKGGGKFRRHFLLCAGVTCKKEGYVQETAVPSHASRLRTGFRQGVMAGAFA